MSIAGDAVSAGYASAAASIISAYQTQQALLAQQIPNNAYPVTAKDNQAPPKDIRAFTRTVAGAATSLQAANQIGTVTRDKSQVSVTAALLPGTKVNYFQFNTATNGNLAIGVASNKGVQVQVLKKDGTVLANSNATPGTSAYNNYKNAVSGQLGLAAGSYYLKVTRTPGTLNSVSADYLIKLSQGAYYTQDYTTTQTPAPKVNYNQASTNDAAAVLLNAANVFSNSSTTGSSSLNSTLNITA